MEAVDRCDEGLHGLLGHDTERRESLGEHGEVAQLVRRELGDGRLVVQGGRELGVLGQLREGPQLAVREGTQQVGHGRPVARAAPRSRLGPPAAGVSTGGSARAHAANLVSHGSGGVAGRVPTCR